MNVEVQNNSIRSLLFLLCTVLFFSCQDKKGNFSVQAPAGWEVVDTISKNSGKFVKMYAPVSTAVPQFVNNINISILKFPSVRLYKRNVLASIKKDALFFEELGSGSVTINKKKWTWEQHVIQYEKSGVKFEQKVYFIEDGGNIYQVVCTARQKGIKEFQSKIDEVLASFKIL